MATTIAELQAKLSVDKSGFDRGLRGAESDLDKRGDGMGKKSALIGKWVTRGLAGGAVGAGLLGLKMIGLASDAAEVESKFRVIFGKEMPKMTKEIDKFAKATGGSRFEMREQVASMGALLAPILKNQKAAAGMSITMTKLAADLGSFNNVPTAEALESIRSGLTGEAEPLKKFGILINESTVKAEAYRSGIAKVGSELTEQQKVQARGNLIMNQSKLAWGDATETSGSMANQMKELKNKLSDTATEIGTRLLPYALRLVTWANDHMPAALDWLGEKLTDIRNDFIMWKNVFVTVKDAINTGLDAIKTAFRALRDAVATVISNILGKIDGFLGGLQAVMEAASHIPGVGDKFEGVANKIGDARAKVRGLRDEITELHGKTIEITVNAGINVAGQELRPGDVFGPGHAKGAMVKATKGGVFMVAEGGYDEAVLSTDPKHKKRTYSLISEVTRRLEGRSDILPGFEAGGFTMGQASRFVGSMDEKAIKVSRMAAQFMAQGMPPAIAYAEARRMESLHKPYLWGGGHGGFSANGPWDCSGAVSQVLHKAGLLGGSPLVSGALMGWGRAGHSDKLEVSANAGHVFMKILGKGFGTSGENPGGGFGDLSYGNRSGFAVRTYDRGGLLPPGLSMAYNGTGRPERVGGAVTNIFNFPHFVGSTSELETAMQRVMVRYEQRNTRPFGSR